MMKRRGFGRPADIGETGGQSGHQGIATSVTRPYRRDGLAYGFRHGGGEGSVDRGASWGLGDREP